MVTFSGRRISEEWTANPGTGTKVVKIPFTPELIRIEFLDAENNVPLDGWDYTITYVGNPDEVYSLTVNWSVTGKPRGLRYTLAELPDFGGIFGNDR